MKRFRFKKKIGPELDDEKRRRKRELFLIFTILPVVAVMVFLETRLIHFGADFPVSNTVLLFILFNINLLLLLLLIFLVFRNLVKLYYDRKRKVAGSKLRMRLLVAFITLTLLPTVVLFFFSINFITASIAFWFNVPVEQTLENTLSVGRQLYSYVEDNNRFFIDRAAYQIEKKRMLKNEDSAVLANYVQVVQREFNLHAVEVYSVKGERIAYAVSEDIKTTPFPVVLTDEFSKNLTENGTRTLSQNIRDGELVRVVGTIPFGAETPEVAGFIVITNLLPKDLSGNLESISRGFEEYQQIKLLKEPIQTTYYIALSIVALLVVFCAVWFAFYLAKTITIPIMELAEGTRRVAEGDLSFQIERTADDEIGTLVDSFNKMTSDLAIGQEQLSLSARILREQNIAIEESRQYMEIVLKNVSTGVISLDSSGLVTTINKSAEKMLSLKAENVLKKSYKCLLRGELLTTSKEIMERVRHSKDGIKQPLNLTIDGSPRSFMANLNALKDDSGRHMGLVMVFDDLTELEKAQRMAAWREVARRIAHEVKNPLTPLTLSAQRLRRKFSHMLEEPVFDECTRTIIDHVDLIRNLVNEFSTYARFPTANPVSCQLPVIIEETLALYRESHGNITFETSIQEQVPDMNLDRHQIKQALINLIDNAISAVKDKGVVSITLTFDSILKRVRLEVADTGEGISDKEKTRLFEPYFSTKKSGMGLGLTIVNSIVSDHNGVISVQDHHPKGAKFVIELPA